MGEYKVHRKKIWIEYVAPMIDGSKPFEVRLEQPGEPPYEEGDQLVLMGWDPAALQFTGHEIHGWITYVLRKSTAVALPEGLVVLGVYVNYHVLPAGAEPIPMKVMRHIDA